MTWQDILNGLFEVATLYFIILNIKAVLQDKEVKGFNIYVYLYFCMWSMWNIFYYYNLGQPISAYGSIVATTISGAYVALVFYFMKHGASIQEAQAAVTNRAVVGSIIFLAIQILVLLIAKNYNTTAVWPDITNSSFELSAGFVKSVNCFIIMRDKKLRGASAAATIFFAVWGTWNLYYYAHLDQWWSMVCGVSIFLANMWYIWLLLKYHYRIFYRTKIL